MDLLEALDQVRAGLESVGIRAEVDPRDVNPPGAWIALDSIVHGAQLAGSTVRTHVYLIVPDTGAAQSTTQLSELLTSVLRVFNPDDDTTTTQVALPSAGGQGLPALRLVIDVPTD